MKKVLLFMFASSLVLASCAGEESQENENSQVENIEEVSEETIHELEEEEENLHEAQDLEEELDQFIEEL
jgi:DNA-binding transcriptional regulator GbsR (MarR family)